MEEKITIFITLLLICSLFSVFYNIFDCIKVHKKNKIWNYRFFLKILRDTKKDKCFDEKLYRMFLLGDFKKDFFIYYNRKNIKESKKRLQQIK
jgi:hypothetical protein